MKIHYLMYNRSVFLEIKGDQSSLWGLPLRHHSTCTSERHGGSIRGTSTTKNGRLSIAMVDFGSSTSQWGFQLMKKHLSSRGKIDPPFHVKNGAWCIWGSPSAGLVKSSGCQLLDDCGPHPRYNSTTSLLLQFHNSAKKCQE